MIRLIFACALAFVTAAHAIELELPIDCEIGRTCAIQQYVDHDPSPKSRDYQCGTLTYDKHNGTDFRLPDLRAQQRGVHVLAAAPGRVLRVRDGMPDVTINAARAPPEDNTECGNGLVIAHENGWETQYCHLARHSLQVKPGQHIAAGKPLGRVGLSGRTEFPHLHFTVRHRGRLVDPFAFGAVAGSCGGGESLWKPATANALGYHARTVLNEGFAGAPVTMQQIEAGEVGHNPLSATASVLVAFVRAIGLKTGDVQHLSIRGPDNAIVADHTAKPLESDKAQAMVFAGRRQPPSGWVAGLYRAHYRVIRDGQQVLESSFETRL